MAWARNGTSDTLSGTADVMTISDLTAKKFNVFLHHQLATTSTNNRVTYDDNSNTDYAWRQSVNGSEATATSQNYTNWNNGVGGSDDRLSIVYVVNIDSEEKLGIGWQVAQNATGAGTSPFRREWVDKCDTSTNTGQFTRIDMNNSGAGDYASGSNLSAIGSELTPASATTIETGSIYIDTDTNNRWWYDGTNWNIQPSTFEDDFSSNSNWTQVGSAITVTGGVAQGSSVPANAEHRIYKDTGVTTEDTKLVMDWKFRMTSMPNGDPLFQIMFSSNTNFGASGGNAVGVQIANESPSNVIRTRSFEVLSGTKNNTGSYGTTLSTNTDYYPRLTLDGTSLTLEVFSDSARTAQVGSDYVKTVTGVTGLKYIQISSTNYGISTACSFTIDDVVIYKEVTSV